MEGLLQVYAANEKGKIKKMRHAHRLACAQRKESKRFPFHNPEASLQAAIYAACACAGVKRPQHISIDADPRRIFRFFRSSFLHFAKKIRKELRMETKQQNWKNLDTSSEILELVKKLNILITPP